MLRAAVDDGLLTSNPAEKLGRQLRLITPKVTRQENIKSMTRDQRQRFLAQAEEDSPHLYHSSLRDLGRYRHAARGGGRTSMERSGLFESRAKNRTGVLGSCNTWRDTDTQVRPWANCRSVP
jgi:hypothetical protein